MTKPDDLPINTHKPSLPGEPDARQRMEQLVRVNHAGEYGAKRIYEGQLAVLKGKPSYDTIRHMAEQEEAHLKAFEEEMVKRQVRPTLLLPLWHVAGFMLGAGTALLGEKAAMACTVAVESVINDHYEEQKQKLDGSESELKQKIVQFQAEEMEHHDTGLAQGAEQAPFYHLLYGAVATGTRAAIWLSKRI
jgi:ubiquinone biosynthesis monooxygenase Coq7